MLAVRNQYFDFRVPERSAFYTENASTKLHGPENLGPLEAAPN